MTDVERAIKCNSTGRGARFGREGSTNYYGAGFRSKRLSPEICEERRDT